LHIHHVKKRSQIGPDAAENLINSIAGCQRRENTESGVSRRSLTSRSWWLQYLAALTDKNSPNGHSTGNPADVKSSAAGEQDGPQNEAQFSTAGEQDGAQNGAQPRTDKNRLHVMRHEVLSRNLLEALVERGESGREWRDLMRELRAELHVEGPVASLFFDRLCSSMLREALISIAERKIFVATDESPGFDSRLKRANEIAIATNSTNVDGPQAVNLLHYLPIMQRYACHQRKEFDHNLGALLELHEGGPKALALFLNRTRKRNKHGSGEAND
jgi:hypothetical protein